MDSYEWNKIFGGLLLAVLVVFGLSNLSDFLFASDPPSHAGDTAMVAEEEASGSEAAAPMAEDTAPVAEEEPAAKSVVAVAAPVGSPENGGKLFKKCAICHTVDQGGKKRLGPNLWGIAGADMAAVAGYSYSSALADAGGVWDDASLDAWMASPRAFISGNKMTFAGVKKAAERADLIAYLKTLSE